MASYLRKSWIFVVTAFRTLNFTGSQYVIILGFNRLNHKALGFITQFFDQWTTTTFFYRSHPVVLSIQLVKYLRHTQQLILKFTQLSATSFLMATCFGRPCDHHQANFNRSCAFIVLTIWDPIKSILFFIWTKITVKSLHSNVWVVWIWT